MAEIDHKAIESISNDLIGILPIIHKQLINFVSEGIKIDISNYHFAILGILSKYGLLPVSEIGRRLYISKPQMTAMVDKLVNLGFVTRSQTTEDRRVINISLTPQGSLILAAAQENIKNNLAVKMSVLNKEDLLAFSAALKIIKEVSSKLN